MNRFLRAICDDDRTMVRRLSRTDPTLAARHIDKAKLYKTGILHWIYVGDTPLHLASAGYRIEIVRLLLAAGADPNSCSNHRRSSPLHYAADGCPDASEWDPGRQVETIQCLIDAGADVHAQDRNGATPLHRAVRTRCAAAVQCLLRAGGDTSTKNKSGSTPFHLAVQNTGRGGTGAAAAIAAQQQIIEEFLLSGVSPEVKSRSGKSVWNSARSEKIRDLLSQNRG